MATESLPPSDAQPTDIPYPRVAELCAFICGEDGQWHEKA